MAGRGDNEVGCLFISMFDVESLVVVLVHGGDGGGEGRGRRRGKRW